MSVKELSGRRKNGMLTLGRVVICTSIASIGRFETMTAQSELCRDGIGGESSGGSSNNDVTDGYTRKVGECRVQCVRRKK